MQLSNVTAGAISLSVQGESKFVTMLTDASAVPYSAYYTMPDGYVSWLSITVSANVFTVTAENNLFSESSRSAVVSFHCMPTSGGTLQTTDVTVTQAADTVSLTFDPTGATLAYTEGASASVAIAGASGGIELTVEGPAWLTPSILSETELGIIAEANFTDTDRTGSVVVFADDRPFYLPVTQSANGVELTFDPTSAEFGYASGLAVDIDITGVPSGASVMVSAPSWITGVYASGTLTLTAAANTTEFARSESVEIVVYNLSFYIPVSQEANPYPNGKLTLNASSKTFTFDGGYYDVSATELPNGVTEMSCAPVPGQGTCAECGQTGNFVTYEQLDATTFRLTVVPLDVFDGIDRAFILRFSAGSSYADFTVTQSAISTAVCRLGGMGDKFLKTARSLQEPAYLIESSALRLYDELKTTGWTMLDTQQSPILVGENRDAVPEMCESLEAYKACHSHVDSLGTTYHKLSMGAMAYRFTFTEDAIGLTVRGIRFKIRTDAYCADGLRVTLETGNDTDAPSDDWSDVRDGSGSLCKKGVGARKIATDGLFYGQTETVLFDGLDLEIEDGTALYLYLTMEDYTGTINGWSYGSGIIDPYFDFYADEDDLPTGMTAGDWIAEASVSESPGTMTVSEDGTISSPTVPAQSDCKTRELLVRDFGVGGGISVPTDAVAFAAIPMLFASVAESGFSAVDVAKLPPSPWPDGQMGLSAYLTRHIGGASSPFQNVLRYVVSPMLFTVALPVGATATTLRLTNRVGAVSSAGADVRLSAYWLPSARLSIEEIGGFAALPGFSSGAALLEIGEKKLTRLGTVALATSLAENAVTLLPIGSLTDSWGTFVLVPWIARVTASTLAVGGTIGLAGPAIDDDGIIGAGWLPKIELEV